jgi:hypothetical protein
LGQATALGHEVYLRLVDTDKFLGRLPWEKEPWQEGVG